MNHKFSMLHEDLPEGLFYIICMKRSRDGFLAFWKPEKAGYTQHIEEAGLYNSEQLKEIINAFNVGDDIPIPVKDLWEKFEIVTLVKVNIKNVIKLVTNAKKQLKP